ncbi:hypothetical protein AVEN_133787-1 [Araneus ventricosus]|uniref:Transposase Tc1-like domain-containing protein n=1 Tax=Araneus ventricosus TaxID=182803 RepID=A0A4Y2L1L2_ARAVE|nr:hypothetical protein AVEN_133787-1 [Araneus ventricosus]
MEYCRWSWVSNLQPSGSEDETLLSGQHGPSPQKVSSKTSNLRHRCDQKKTLKERDRRRPTRNLKRVRRATLPQIAADINAGALTSVSVRTVERTIIDMGLGSRNPTRVPLLTARHTAFRLAWARQQRHWTVDDWKHVASSDESHF